MPVEFDNGIVNLQSGDAVEDVLHRLLAILREKNLTAFAVIDHSGEAAKVGLQMPDTKLVIFGKPEAGTPVMVAAPHSALDLPLKILLAASPNGGTEVSYNSPDYLQSRHGFPAELIKNVAAIEQIAAAIVTHI